MSSFIKSDYQIIRLKITDEKTVENTEKWGESETAPLTMNVRYGPLHIDKGTLSAAARSPAWPMNASSPAFQCRIFRQMSAFGILYKKDFFQQQKMPY
jgi:hypothetical protein